MPFLFHHTFYILESIIHIKLLIKNLYYIDILFIQRIFPKKIGMLLYNIAILNLKHI